MVERGERAAHARCCSRSAGSSQADQLHGHRRRHRGRCTQTGCTTLLGVCKRCSGINSHSEGVVGVLGAMVERGEHDDAFGPHSISALREGARSLGAPTWLGEAPGSHHRPAYQRRHPFRSHPHVSERWGHAAHVVHRCVHLLFLQLYSLAYPRPGPRRSLSPEVASRVAFVRSRWCAVASRRRVARPSTLIIDLTRSEISARL